MNKRAVSPVIATVLLIALVTAAAAIVFLVVIPMLTPANAILVAKSADFNDSTGNTTVIIGISAEGADIIFNGTIVSSPTVAYLEFTTTIPLSISNGATKDLKLVGSFARGVEHTITLTFVAGKNEFSQVVKITPA